MKVDPNHLEILAATVDNGGLTEGAKALNKSQPSVSRSLSALEKRLRALGQAAIVHRCGEDFEVIGVNLHNELL